MYVFLNRKSKGKLGISQTVFKTIGENTLSNIEDIILKPLKPNAPYSNVIINIRDNKVTFRFNIVANKEIDEDEIKVHIVENLTSSMFIISEMTPSEVTFKFNYIK